MRVAGAEAEASAVSIEELNRLVGQAHFLKPFGFTVQACAYGVCELLVPFDPQLERPGGVVSGITIMAAADVAMWLAIMTQRGPQEQWVTTDLKVAFLRGVRQESFSCRAQVLKLGKRNAYGEARCTGAAGGLIAHHVIRYARLSA